MKHVSVRMGDEIYKKLEKMSKSFGIPKSWLIRRAVESYLDKLERIDCVELALALAEEVDPTEEEKKIIEEYKDKPIEGIPHEEAKRLLGL